MAWTAVFAPPEFEERYLAIMLAALVDMNVLFLKERPSTPSLYQSGVRYKREPKTLDHWISIPFVLRRRFGDCEDLASWRAAELRVHGEDASAIPKHVKTWPDGSKLFHILVKRGNGRLEDPSKRLGMG